MDHGRQSGVDISLCALDETIVAAVESGADRHEVADAVAGRLLAGRYRLGPMLGSGAFGCVFEATDVLSGVGVAVKLIRGLDDDTLATVRRESATLRLLRLPGVVSLLDEGTDGDRHFLVTQRVHGAHFPGRLGQATWDEIREPTLGLLEALARVHQSGVVHRDIKPANVLVDEEGHVTLIDFGVANAPGYAGTELAIHGTAGTPIYLAPEQVSGVRATAQTDLYCLGVMLFEILGGRLPHDDVDIARLMRAKTTVSAPPLASVAPDVPGIVCDVIDRMLARGPRKRPESAWEILQTLRGLPVGDPFSQMLAPWATGGVIDAPGIEGLVAGFEPFLRLRSDTAHELLLRTDGDVDAVIEQLRSWQRARLARADGGRIHIERSALDRLRAGLRVAPDQAPRRDVIESLSEDDRDLLCWMEVAWPSSSAQFLCASTGWPEGRVAEGIARLAAARLTRDTGDGRWMPRGSWLMSSHWDAARVGRAHSAVGAVLAPGTPGRLMHLLRSGDTSGVIPEALAAAKRHHERGELHAVLAIVHEGLTYARTIGHDEAPLLERAVCAACVRGTRELIDTAMHLLHTAQRTSPDTHRMLDLCNAMQLAASGDTTRAVALADEIGRFDSPELESWRIVVYARDSLMGPVDERRTQYDRILADAAADDAIIRHRLQVWDAQLMYVEQRFEEMAELEDSLAAAADGPLVRLGRLQGQARALVHAGRVADAVTVAIDGRDLAAGLRDGYMEAMFDAVVQGARYAMGEPVTWSDDHADAAIAACSASGAAGALCAMIGHRARNGDADGAVAIARRTVAHAHELRESPAAFIRAMMWYLCEEPPPPPVVADLLDVARRLSVPGVDAQTAHILRSIDGEHVADAQAVLDAALAQLTIFVATARREVFADAELRSPPDEARAARRRWLGLR